MATGCMHLASRPCWSMVTMMSSQQRMWNCGTHHPSRLLLKMGKSFVHPKNKGQVAGFTKPEGLSIPVLLIEWAEQLACSTDKWFSVLISIHPANSTHNCVNSFAKRYTDVMVGSFLVQDLANEVNPLVPASKIAILHRCRPLLT